MERLLSKEPVILDSLSFPLSLFPKSVCLCVCVVGSKVNGSLSC